MNENNLWTKNCWMDLSESFTHPKAKKWRAWQYQKKIKPFPVTSISEDNPKFTGYFTGISVEVFDEKEIYTLYDSGGYGIGSQTKGTPRVLYATAATKRTADDEEHAHESKRLALDDAIQPPGQTGDAGVESDAPPVLIPRGGAIGIPPHVDKPFLNLSESLVLYPEEAFFLHHSLKCLRVNDPFQNEELTTAKLLQKFCTLNKHFITHFVAYQYFRSQNWVVKCGLKYGGHFCKLSRTSSHSIKAFDHKFIFSLTVLYYKGPQFYHASFIVIVEKYQEDKHHLMEFKDLQGLYRLGETCKKDILFLQVKYPEHLTATDAEMCLANLSSFQVLEMSPKRVVWSQLHATDSI